MNVIDLLKSHPFGVGLSEAQVEALGSSARVSSFPAGAFVFREHVDADALYLIVRGRVVLEQHVPGKGDVQLESLTGGDMFGLSWLFPNGRWLLDARVVDAAEAIVLDAASVHALMNSDSVLGFALAKHVIAQLYSRLERVRLQRLDVYRGKE